MACAGVRRQLQDTASIAICTCVRWGFQDPFSFLFGCKERLGFQDFGPGCHHTTTAGAPRAHATRGDGNYDLYQAGSRHSVFSGTTLG